jgi:hypothetical protein
MLAASVETDYDKIILHIEIALNLPSENVSGIEGSD